jgi:two-component sensor histidine kinase
MLAPIAEFIGRVSDRRSSTALFSMCVFMLFGLIDAAVDKLMLQARVDFYVHTSVQAAVVGIAACLVSVVLLTARGEQRKIVRQEIQRVMEVNHRLRNSLQVIAYAHYSEGAEAREMMLEAVRSMDSTLKELFPTLGVERRSEERQESILS